MIHTLHYYKLQYSAEKTTYTDTKCLYLQLCKDHLKLENISLYQKTRPSFSCVDHNPLYALISYKLYRNM